MENILFIGDVHVKFNNLKDLDILNKKLETEFNHDDISFIVLAGDILDTHEKIYTQLMNKAYSLILNMRKIAPVYILVGNHDYINNQQFLTENHWMNGMKEWNNVNVIDYPLRIEQPNGSSFIFVPYVPVGRFTEALNKITDWEKSTCIFGHQEIKNCKMGCITSWEGDEWKEEWPMLISGHIHEQQKVSTNVLYPGSVLNHSFGSDNQGISKFVFDKSSLVNEYRINLNLEKKSIIYKKINQVDDISQEKLVVQNKLQLIGELKDIKTFQSSQKYNELKKKGIRINFKIVDDTECLNSKVVPFSTILENLIEKERDVELKKDFISVQKQCQHI